MSLVPQALVALTALGMSLAFVSADRNSPTSRALAAALASMGLAVLLNVSYFARSPLDPSVPGWTSIPEASTMIFFLEWMLRVRRTLPARSLDVSGGDHLLRLGQILALIYCALSFALPDMRSQDFLFAADNAGALTRPGFWLFAVPVMLASVTGIFSILLLLNRRPDSAERTRIFALAAATPFLTAGFVLPPDWGAVSVTVGEAIFLIGAVRYHVMQGQRGLFMSRFLSSQVAALVRERGLTAAMQQQHLELTVVVCDLRGFTAYAAHHKSSRVIAVLREYYDAVGAVVAAYEATIKDYAGDGILILVGAPIPIADHARRGLALARHARESARKVIQKWSDDEGRLGVGVGVATGFVTVGVIGGESRLEYAAVGHAVNLASRLCEAAADGEILIDARTVELSGDEGLKGRSDIIVKGIVEPVVSYAA